ncbi:hypothetical protein GX48_05001 [Paracoccidioides brasiliensis]|nr:hypothetical protein GX48_05001 [Paracoccidioides brasiliensis]
MKMNPPSRSTSSPKKRKKQFMSPSRTLIAIHTSLHLLYHRNKNQHGAAKWWKWLAMLKRSMAELVALVRRYERYGDEYDNDDGFRVKVLERMRYMHFWIVPRCYIAFSTVVADTQFTSMGVVLLATLAQAAQAVAQAGENQSPVVNYALEVGASNAAATTTTPVSTTSDKHASVDFGEVVKRTVYVPCATDSVEKAGSDSKKGRGKGKSPTISVAAIDGREGEGLEERSNCEVSSVRLSGHEEEAVRQKRKKLNTKRKKRKGDAIDDIFGDLCAD